MTFKKLMALSLTLCMLLMSAPQVSFGLAEEEAPAVQEEKPAPATPVPATPVPATPVPATPVPATPVPATPVPATPVPATPVPVTPEPVTPVPATPEPATPVPATPEPATPVPATPEPATPVPAAPEPAEPVAETPEPSDPTTPEPVPEVTEAPAPEEIELPAPEETEQPEQPTVTDAPADEATATPTAEATVEATAEPTPVPQEVPEITSLSAPTSATLGKKAAFTFSAKNAARLEYQLTGPDGGNVDSGTLGGGASSYAFTPDSAGTYVFSLTAVSGDGATAQASASVAVNRPSDLAITLEAEKPSCFAGDAVKFKVGGITADKVSSCTIQALRNGEVFHESAAFAETFSVTPPAIRRVCNITVNITVVDTRGHSGSASVTIPCAYHDPETQAQWESTMRGVNKTGVWPDDLIAIARTQIGYHESTVDFGPKYAGGYSGYTRYGDWFGLDYEEWCAMFVGFCMRYAGIPAESFPFAANCQRWINAIRPLGLYAARGSYTPQVGDLVFFEWGSNNDSDHIGIVYKLHYNDNGSLKGLTTIEGNSRASVTDDDYYAINDTRIMGYGLVHLAYERKLARDLRAITASTDHCVVTTKVTTEAGLPAGAALSVTEIDALDPRYEALVQNLTDKLSESGTPLNFARFYELRFRDAYGALTTPKATVPTSMSLDEIITTNQYLMPGLAEFDATGTLKALRRAVLVDHVVGSSVYSFNQEDFSGIIGLFVSGEERYEAGQASFLGEDYAIEVGYEAEARIPIDATLNVRECAVGSLEYNACIDNLKSKDALPDAASARIFVVGLYAFNQRVTSEAGVDVTLRSNALTGGVSIVQLPDGSLLPSELTADADGQPTVTFHCDGFTVFALITVPETPVELGD